MPDDHHHHHNPPSESSNSSLLMEAAAALSLNEPEVFSPVVYVTFSAPEFTFRRCRNDFDHMQAVLGGFAHEQESLTGTKSDSYVHGLVHCVDMYADLQCLMTRCTLGNSFGRSLFGESGSLREIPCTGGRSGTAAQNY